MGVLKMERLRELRRERNMSQQMLADIIGVTQQAVHKYEYGLAQPEFNTLIQLSKLFHVSIDYLIENPEFDCTYEYRAKTSDDRNKVLEIEITPSEYHYLSLYKKLSPQSRQSIEHILEAMTDNNNN